MTVGESVRHLRKERGIGQATLARDIGRLPQDLYKWEHGRQVPSDAVPALAKALGVTICGLYGVDEGHQVPAQLSLAEQIAQALGVEPARIEVNVYGRQTEEFVPTEADRDTRDIVRAWNAMPESVQQEWLAFAAGIREEKGE